MELSIQVYFIVCPLVFLAGLVDSIAGGGGLIALPAYLMAGISPHFALGTNKLSSLAGTIIASFRYYKNKFVDIFLCLPSIPVALIGSALGSSLALLVDEQIIRWVILLIIPIAAFYVFRKKSLDINGSPLSRPKTIAYSVIISFFMGAYDGFSGPGTGTFLILLYNGIAKIDVRTASGNAKLVNLASGLSALILFLVNGRVLIPLGFSAALFNMLGAYIGSGLVINKGTKIIRYTIFIILTLIFIKMVWDII